MANGIKLGTLDISAFKVGSDDCKVYLGSTLLYSGGTTPPTNNVISYSANTKLSEITGTGYTNGFHIDSFSGASGQLTLLDHTFENGVGTIEFDDDIINVGINAFYKTSIENIILPNTITTYGNYCFYQCYQLKSIELSENVISIGSGTFRECSSDFSFYINATTPPTLGTNTFYASSLYPIYVPSGSVDTYKAANGWKDYKSRIQAIPNS